MTDLNNLDSLNALSNFKSNNDFKIYKNLLRKNYQNNLYTQNYFDNFDENTPKKINSKQTYYFNYASNIALNSNMFQKHGAIIVYKKNIVATGFNSYSNLKKNNFSIHAEINAINNFIKKYDKSLLHFCELYVVRISPSIYNSKEYLLKYSKPCINCQKIINKFNIPKIYYSTNYDYDNYLSKNFLNL